VPSSATAGALIHFSISAHDLFSNLCSTGPNIYLSTVVLSGEPFQAPQTPSFSPLAGAFGHTDSGYKSYTNENGLILKKAGSRWIKATQQDNPTIHTEVPGFSVRPYIDVSPGLAGAVAVSPGPTNQVINVRAGSKLAPGMQEFTGQLADVYNNPLVSSAPVYIQVVGFSGSSGSLAYNEGAGWVTVESTYTYSDSKGRVGNNGDADNTNPHWGYYVSPVAGNYARVWIGTMAAPADLAPFISDQRNLSGTLLTVGGEVKHLVLTGVTPFAPVTGDAEGGGEFTVERRDDFDNPTDYGQTDILLNLPAGEVDVRTRAGFSPGIPNTRNGDYGFVEPNSPYNYINSISIVHGIKEARFRYRDKMSSYAGIDPEQNLGNGGRPGRWTLNIAPTAVDVSSATYLMRLDPLTAKTLGMGNPVNRQVAGRVHDVGGSMLRSFQVQVQDRFNNPTVLAAPMDIHLTTVARRASTVDDAFSFSASSEIAPNNPPLFEVPVTSVTIPALQFEATFYYLDTMASSSYPPSESSRPVVGVYDPAEVLLSSAQFVNIQPDVISRIAVPPVGDMGTGIKGELLAGATCGAVVFQVQDRFGNPSPVKDGQQDTGLDVIEFYIRSDSLGKTQFSSPDPGAFVASTGIARVPIGFSATGFYLIDTKVSASTQTPWTVTVDTVKNRMWTVASGTYTVTPGPPVSAGFTTPNRYLIAGTTVQLSTTTQLPVETPIDVELYDQFGNVTKSTWAFHTLMVKSQNSATTRGGQVSTKEIKDGSDWRKIGPADSPLPITFDIGSTRARFFIWDTKVGTTTLQASVFRQDGFAMPVITQPQYVTPSRADYITIYHPYTQLTPLHVGDPGVLARSIGGRMLGVTLRDKFGNVASGHSINRQYFSGLVLFGTSGSTLNVILQDLTLSTTTPNSHLFLGESDPTPGVFTGLQIQDFIVEQLTIYATAQADTTLWGKTHDLGRSFNDFLYTPDELSDDNVFTAGVVVFPTDMAPEKNPDGTVLDSKKNVGQNRPVIRQGDGSTPSSPNPVEMLRLSMSVSPPTASHLSAEFSGLQVRRIGQLQPSHISEVALYVDADGNGQFSTDYDVFIATAVLDGQFYFFGDSTHGQTELQVVNSTYTKLTTTAKNFFLTIRLAPSGYAEDELPSSLGFEIPSPFYVRFTPAPASQVGIASNNFAVKTATSPVEREAARINVRANDISPWWALQTDTAAWAAVKDTVTWTLARDTVTAASVSDPGEWAVRSSTLPWWDSTVIDESVKQTLSSFSFVNQGASAVGVMKLRLWTDQYTGVIDRVRVTHLGTGRDEDIKNIRLFVDSGADGDPSKGNGLFEAFIDTEVTPNAWRRELGSLCANDPPEAKPTDYSIFSLRSVELNLCILNPTLSSEPSYQAAVKLNEIQRTVSESTITYFVVFDYASDAMRDRSHGAQINGPSEVIPLAGNGVVQSFMPLLSANVTVRATPDLAYVEAVDTEGEGRKNSVATSVTQNDKDAPVSKLTLKATGSAIWSGIKLDRWVHSRSLGGAIKLLNKASDVDEIRVWSDADGNGLLDAKADLFGNTTDQIVSPKTGIVHKFPVGRLKCAPSDAQCPVTGVAISSTTPSPINVYVTNIADFLPSDDPFPAVPQRLVFNDEQTDEDLKEVMHCADVDMDANVWRNCTRAMEGTTQLSFSSTTAISGPARIPIIGMGGGQSLTEGDRNFFVAYDINPLATVGDQSNLGLIIPNTFYFIIQPPKRMDTVNIGLPPTGKTRSLIPNVAEFADKVTVVSSNTYDDSAMGAYLQQKTTGAVMSFTLNTNVADTYWRFVTLYATGTSMLAGSNKADVDQVSIWLDVNDNNKLEQGAGEDLLIGTGTFGNSGSPQSSRVTLFTPQRIKTLATRSVSQRYIVAYLMSAEAVTNDPVTQDPRTLGASLHADSFPKGLLNDDDATENAFSHPNYYDTASVMPFGSRVREIIPSQRTLYVRLTPMFGTALDWKFYEAPALPALPSLIESFPAANQWFVSSLAGLSLSTAAPLACSGGNPVYVSEVPGVAWVGELRVAYQRIEQVCESGALRNRVDGVPTLGLSEGAAFRWSQPADSDGSAYGGVDPYWLISSTVGLPAGGPGAYMVAYSSEIISYEDLGSVELPSGSGSRYPALLSVHRGLLDTKATGHLPGTYLAPRIQQGQTDFVAMKLDAYSSGFQVRWSDLRTIFQTPGTGLNSQYSDLDAVKLYKKRVLSTGQERLDLVAVARPNDKVVDLDIRDTQPDADYTLVPTSTITYYLAIDLAQATLFSHESLTGRRNEVVGTYAPAAANFTLGPAEANHKTVLLNAPATPGFPIVPAQNTLEFEFFDIVGKGVRTIQNAQFVSVSRLKARTTTNTVRWKKIRLDRDPSTSLDTDITAVRIWRDADGDEEFTEVDRATNSLGNYIHMVSPGGAKFSTGTVTIEFNPPIVVSTTPQYFFVSYDLQQFAAVGARQGLRVATTGYIEVELPNTATIAPKPYVVDPPIVIEKSTSVVTMGIYDWIGLQNVQQVSQAQTKVPLLRFNLKTDVSTARWESLRVSRGGGSQEEGRLFGRNSNVTYVRIFKDLNQNDLLDDTDLNVSETETRVLAVLSPGTLDTPPEVYTATAPPFELVVPSTQGFPPDGLGDILVGGAELMKLGGYGQRKYTSATSTATYPTLLVSARAGRLDNSNTPVIRFEAFGASSGTLVRKVDLFDQNEEQERQHRIDLAVPQTISPTAGVYFLTYDVAPTAIKNDEVSVDIEENTWLGINQADGVPASLVNLEVTKTLPSGTRSDKFPFRGTKVFIRPVALTIAPLVLAPKTAIVGQKSVQMLELRANVSANFTRVGSLKLKQKGTWAGAARGIGKGDLRTVTVWRDSGDAIFTPDTDLVVGSATYSAFPAGSADFRDGEALISLRTREQGTLVPYLTVSTQTVTLFVSVDISSVDAADITTSLATDVSSTTALPLLVLSSSADFSSVGGALYVTTAPAISTACYSQISAVIYRSTADAPAVCAASYPIEKFMFQTITSSVIGSSTYPAVQVFSRTGAEGTLLAGSFVRYERPTENDEFGLSLESFADILGPDGSQLSVEMEEDTADRFPMDTSLQGLVKIVRTDIPMLTVNVNRAIIITPSTYADRRAVGYPAFANRVDNEWVIDPSYWIWQQGLGKKTQATAEVFSEEPLIDVTGDGLPDNFDFMNTGKRTFISLIGIDKPSLDLDGNKTLDVDINNDNIPDEIVLAGEGAITIYIKDKSGNTKVSRAAKQSWVADGTFRVSWDNPTSTEGLRGWQVAAGVDFVSNTTLTDGWDEADSSGGHTLKGLRLPARSQSTNLTANMGADETLLTVADTRLGGETRYEGLVAVGAEFMHVEPVSNTQFRTVSVANDGCPSAGNGRGCKGSNKQAHFLNEFVSKAEEVVVVSVRGYKDVLNKDLSAQPSSTGTAILLMRVDGTAPSAPANLQMGAPTGGVFSIAWTEASDAESGVAMYELQERKSKFVASGATGEIGVDPVWRTIGIIPAKQIPAGAALQAVTDYRIGDPKGINSAEAPRDSGLFLQYRVRAINGAGRASAWSQVSATVATSQIKSVISKVSNYPNPFDTRKGGPQGKTVIVYNLGADSDVTITIYDLLGYVVRTFKFNPGEMGGRLGPNFVDWDGKNGMGRLVSKGGYIARIKVGSSLGTETVIRKIGVIH